MIDVVTLAIAEKFTKDTAIGLGAVRGAPCTIIKTEQVQGGTEITFQWTGDDGSTRTRKILVKDGISITDGIILNSHLVFNLSDGTSIDCGELPNTHAENIEYENETFPTLTNIKDAMDIALQGSATLEKNLTVSNPLGSATNGKIYTVGTKLEKVLRDILIKEVAPNLSLAIVPSTTLYDVVDTVISTIQLKATVSKNTYDLSKVEFYLGNTLKHTQNISTNGTYTYDLTFDPPTNSDFTVKAIVYDKKNGTPMTNTKSITIKFVGKSYYGTISDSAGEPTEAIIKALQNNVLKDTKNLTYSGITMDYGKVVYAYPSSFGNLSSIKDIPNNIQYWPDSFTKITMNVDSIPYNVYFQNESSASEGISLTFS